MTIREFVTVKRMTKHEEKSEEDDVDKKENLIMTQIQTTTTSKNIAGNKKTPKMKVPRTMKTRKFLTKSDQKPITSFFITRNQAGTSSSSQTKDPQTIKDEEKDEPPQRTSNNKMVEENTVNKFENFTEVRKVGWN